LLKNAKLERVAGGKVAYLTDVVPSGVCRGGHCLRLEPSALLPVDIAHAIEGQWSLLALLALFALVGLERPRADQALRRANGHAESMFTGVLTQIFFRTRDGPRGWSTPPV